MKVYKKVKKKRKIKFKKGKVIEKNVTAVDSRDIKAL